MILSEMLFPEPIPKTARASIRDKAPEKSRSNYLQTSACCPPPSKIFPIIFASRNYNTMTMKVISVNISREKGTIKTPAQEIMINERGVEGDAHAGDWHRQVSLLSKESILKWSKQAGRKVNWGEFAENITTEGITLYNTKPGDRLTIGETKLEITQIGKKCHGKGCAIFKEVGNCVMPTEGIFAKVISGGKVSAGDAMAYFPGRQANFPEK
jgi:MOSC domain-containing protein YiiM